MGVQHALGIFPNKVFWTRKVFWDLSGVFLSVLELHFILGIERGGVEYTFPDPTYCPNFGYGSTGNGNSFLVTDFVQDGLSEIYLTRLDSEVFFFKAIDNTPLSAPTNWVGIALEAVDGTENYYGIGATVTVTTDEGHIQAQVVDGGSGKGVQRSLDLVFGLGDFTGSTVDVEVKWPGGTLQTAEVAVGAVDTLRLGAPTLDSGSVTSYSDFHFLTQQYDWVFEWETDKISDVTKDKVVFNCTGLSFDCTPVTPNCELKYGQNRVTMTIEEIGGVFLHKVVWRNVGCEAPCIIPFTVESGQSTFVTKSTEKTKKNMTCMVTN